MPEQLDEIQSDEEMIRRMRLRGEKLERALEVRLSRCQARSHPRRGRRHPCRRCTGGAVVSTGGAVVSTGGAVRGATVFGSPDGGGCT